MHQYTDEYFMDYALREAKKAFEEEEIPIGAIVVIDNKIISKGRNQVEQLNDATAHAEIMALTSAFNQLGSKYLPGASLYVTIEPCHMCAGALYWSKVSRIIFGAPDAKQGYTAFCGTRSPFHPKAQVTGGVMMEECAGLMKEFFRLRRK